MTLAAEHAETQSKAQPRSAELMDHLRRLDVERKVMEEEIVALCEVLD